MKNIRLLCVLAAWVAMLPSGTSAYAQNLPNSKSKTSSLKPGQLIKPVKTQVNLIGWLTIVWRDSPGDLAASEDPLFFLTDDSGEVTLLDGLDFKEMSYDLLAQYNGKHVQVNGFWSDSANAHGSRSRLLVNHLTLVDNSFAASELQAVTGPQPWVTVMCKFQDFSAEPKPLSFFTNMYASIYPGLDHYWREVSYNKINLLGSTARGWYTLPNPRSYYVYDSNGDGKVELNHSRAATDCTNAANADIYFPAFVGINLMFNADLDGYAWGGAFFLNIDGQYKTYRMTWEPPWGYQNISVMAHETGHGFGLPHSSGKYGATYDNAWDVMSNSWLCRINDPVYKCVGQHTISAYKDKSGWYDPGQVFTIPQYSRATINLERSALPQPGGFLMAKIPIDDSSTHFYTVESRQRVPGSYDNQLPGSAVIIHEVINGYAYVLDPDNNGNTADEGAMWTPGETFSDPDHQISVTVDSEFSTGYVVTISLAPNFHPAPVLSHPRDLAIIEERTPELSWYSAGEGLNYRIQVDDNPDFSSPLVDQIDTSLAYTFQTPLSDGMLFWRVQVWDDNEPQSNWSKTWRLLLASSRNYFPLLFN